VIGPGTISPSKVPFVTSIGRTQLFIKEGVPPALQSPHSVACVSPAPSLRSFPLPPMRAQTPPATPAFF